MFNIIPDELILIIYNNLLEKKYDNFKNLLILSKRFNKLSNEYINNNKHPFFLTDKIIGKKVILIGEK